MEKIEGVRGKEPLLEDRTSQLGGTVKCQTGQLAEQLDNMEQSFGRFEERIDQKCWKGRWSMHRYKTPST